MKRIKMDNKKILPVYACLIMLTITAVFSGCIAVEPVNDDNAGSDQLAEITSETSSSGRSTATLTDPIPPGGSPQLIRDFEKQSGEMTTENLRVTFRSHKPVFHTSFSPRFSSQGIRVDVMKGPLLVNYQAYARQSDPRISFLVITIRDLETGAVVTQDGYGEPFSSTREKQIIVYGDGPFHINIYGNQMDVDVDVYTGDA
jgi:hypothetical protein